MRKHLIYFTGRSIYMLTPDIETSQLERVSLQEHFLSSVLCLYREEVPRHGRFVLHRRPI